MKKTKPTAQGIGLFEAIAAMKDNLDDFQTFWLEARKKDPDNCLPNQPSIEEWEDQFRAWLEVKDDLP